MLKEDFFFSQKSHEQRFSFLTNEIKAKLFYLHNNTYLKLQYSNRFFDSRETNFLNLPGIEYDTQQNMVQNVDLHFIQEWNKLKIELAASWRALQYKYPILEEEDDDKDDDEDEYEARTANDYDLFTMGEIQYSLIPDLGFFFKTAQKNDLNELKYYDSIETSGSIFWKTRPDLFNIFSARFYYLNQNSEAIEEIFRHNLLLELRYTKRFFIPLSGFIALKSRTVYDEETKKLYRTNTLLRAHLKYNYLTENTVDSYFLAGIKYNPENNGNLIFAEINQYIWNGLYLNLGAKTAPDQYDNLAGKIEYFFNPLQSIWLKADDRDFRQRPGQTIISIGSTIIF